MRAAADVDAREEEHGCTMLVAASFAGNEAMVAALLQRGASVNLQSSKGDTALMNASLLNHPAVVRQLLAAGADPALRDEEGETAADLAESKGHAAVVALLHEQEPHAGRPAPAVVSDGKQSSQGESASGCKWLGGGTLRGSPLSQRAALVGGG